MIDDCDYYLLIIGGRYGTVTPEGLSYTEKEYDYAVERGLKVIALIHGAPEQIPAGKIERTQEAAEKLSKFREKVSQGRLVKFWTQLGELPGLVALSLSKTIKTYSAVGWVRGDALANTAALSELNELRKRNMELEAQIAKLQDPLGSRGLYGGKTFEELVRIFSKRHIKIDFDNSIREMAILEAINDYGERLAVGVVNANIKSFDGVLFEALATPLMLYGLTDFLPVPSDARWQRLGLTESGRRFVSEVRASSHFDPKFGRRE